MSTSASSSAAPAVTDASSAVAFAFATGASSTAAVASATSSAFAASTMSAALAATIAAAVSCLATAATINPPATSASKNSGAATSSAPSPAASFNFLAAPIPAAASSLAPATTADTGILSMRPAAISAAAIPSIATSSGLPTAPSTFSAALAVTIAAAASSLATGTIAATASLSVPPAVTSAANAVIAAASSATAFVVAATVASSSSTAAPVAAAEIEEDLVVSAGGARGITVRLEEFHSHDDVTLTVADRIMIDQCLIVLSGDGTLYQLIDDDRGKLLNKMGYKDLRQTDDTRRSMYGLMLSDGGISIHPRDGSMTYVPSEPLFIDAIEEPPMSNTSSSVPILPDPLPVLEWASIVDEPPIDLSFLSDFASSPGQTSVQIRDVVRSAFELAFTSIRRGQTALPQIVADYLVEQYPASAVAYAARAVLYCWIADFKAPDSKQFLLIATESAKTGSFLAPESRYMMWLRASILCDLGYLAGELYHLEATELCYFCLGMKDNPEDELVFDVAPPACFTEEIPAPTHFQKIQGILSMCRDKLASPFWFDRFKHRITPCNEGGHQKDTKTLEDNQEKHQP